MLIIDASGYRSHVLAAGVFVLAQLSPLAAQAPTGTVRVQVRASATAVEDAEVIVAATTHRTDASGTTVITAAPGVVDIAVVKTGFVPATASVRVTAGTVHDVVVDLQPQPTLEETVTVVASTRTDKRLEDQPMRVEVLAREEIEEKMLMTPGDIVMMLNEMGGMRVQATSSSLGAASVRIQGMRGRYTQGPVGRPAALRRGGRARADANPADGPRPGGGHQGRRIGVVRSRRNGRRHQSPVAASSR